MEDIREEYDEYLSRVFLMFNQRCEVNSFIIESKTANGYALLTLKKIKFTTYRPEFVDYKKVEMEWDVEEFKDVQLLSFLLVITEAAYLACADFPDWFLYGYKTEPEYNEVCKEMVRELWP